jgi:outer membrane usher protein
MPPFTGARRPALALRLVRPLVLGAGVFALADPRAMASDPPLSFDANFMQQSGHTPAHAGQLALDALALRNELGPGRYLVDVSVNMRPFGQRELDFIRDDQGQLQACLSGAVLEELGVNLGAVADLQHLQAPCLDLPTAIAGAFSSFDSGKLALAVSIPQAALRRDSTNNVPRERWDHGINSAFVSYQASMRHGRSATGRVDDSQDLYLVSGLNLGAWRLRSNQSLRNDGEGSQWQRAYTYAERDVPGTAARLTLGETYTGGEVFKSVPIIGATLASDMAMLPDSALSYAPIIRGVAQSRARVEVLQNGYPIYSTYVSAGPYVLDDLSTGGGSGELEIVLTEEDGQVRRFTQPYSSLGNLMRKDTWRYRASAGRYHAPNQSAQPMVWQGDMAMGIGWQSTVYGGLMFSDFYQARNLGLARDFGALGALSMDVTLSDADTGSHDHGLQGASYALRYGKAFATRTNLRFAGYRYSTQKYRDFDEALHERNRDARFLGSRRSRLEAALFQGVGARSSLSLTLSHEAYWASDYERKQFQLYFNTSHQGVSYSLFASQSLADQRTPSDRQFGISVSVPLNTPRATASYDLRNSANQWTQRANLSGSAGDNRYTYNAAVTQQAQRQRSASVGLGYQAPYASMGGGYSHSDSYQSLSLNLSGAVLAHADGLAFGPYLGDTIGLVHVPDTPGIGVANAGATRTDARGYALVPYLQPYRVNQVELKTDRLGPDLALDNGTTQVVPTRGAVVKATFSATRQQPVVLSVTARDGQPLPFGAQVLDASGTMLSVVGQGGQIMLATLAGAQTLHVRWAESLCQLHLDPESMPQRNGYRLQDLTCDPRPTALGTLPSQELNDEA